MGKKTQDKPREVAWPDDIPILTEKDLCWVFSTADGRHDLGVWLDIAFPEADGWTEAHNEVHRVLLQVIREHLGRASPDIVSFLIGMAKEGKPSLAFQAACWNETMHRVGYDVPSVVFPEVE